MKECEACGMSSFLGIRMRHVARGGSITRIGRECHENASRIGLFTSNVMIRKADESFPSS